MKNPKIYTLLPILFTSILLFAPHTSIQAYETQVDTQIHETATRATATHAMATSPTTSPTGGERGRVQIANNTVVADNGFPLRGEAMFLTDVEGSSTFPFTLPDHLYNLDYWQTLRDDFHLNTVRLFIMRPPQNWGGGPGSDCFPPIYRCYELDYQVNPPDTARDIIDDIVDIAGQMGMYIIIDYHPVGGYDRDDAIAWWTEMAPRYQNRTHVIYELANEPVRWNAASYDADDIQFEEDLFTLIRSLAPDTHIITWTFAEGSGPMLSKVNQGTDISYDNASVGYHPYNYNESDVQTLRAQYPVINTEIGADRVNQTDNAEDIDVSWIWLDGVNTHGLPGDFDPQDVYWPADPGTQPTVALPVISPSSPLYVTEVTVSITTSTPNADIRYTLNGTEPNEGSTLYATPFTLSENTTVKAKGFSDSLGPSPTATKTYVAANWWIYLPFTINAATIGFFGN